MKGVVKGMSLALCALFACAALCACSSAPDNQGADEGEGEPLKIVEFSYRSAGSNIGSIYSYDLVQEDAGLRFVADRMNLAYADVVIEEPALDVLGEIAGRHHVDSWDGFDKSKREVSDGESFSLRLVLADGTTVTARGSNAFPKGYRDAVGEMTAYLFELEEKYATDEYAREEY